MVESRVRVESTNRSGLQNMRELPKARKFAAPLVVAAASMFTPVPMQRIAQADITKPMAIGPAMVDLQPIGQVLCWRKGLFGWGRYPCGSGGACVRCREGLLGRRCWQVC
jgi:hypothetical protein